MNRLELVKQIHRLKSFLCVGLDPDINKIPECIKLTSKEPVLEFCKKIIKATQHQAVAYKPNIAFFESLGVRGQEILKEVINYIPNDKFIILDVKRGDIGSTAQRYAETYFKQLNVDAVTLSPYMGKDSITPFLEGYKNKWIILLALTSNEGAKDFQLQKMMDNKFLFEKIIEVSKCWGSEENLMYVVGATQSEFLKKIRTILPKYFLLVPGIGVQKGAFSQVVKDGLIKDEVGLLINVSRAILYASPKEDFEQRATEVATFYQRKMVAYLS